MIRAFAGSSADTMLCDALQCSLIFQHRRVVTDSPGDQLTCMYGGAELSACVLPLSRTCSRFVGVRENRAGKLTGHAVGAALRTLEALE